MRVLDWFWDVLRVLETFWILERFWIGFELGRNFGVLLNDAVFSSCWMSWSLLACWLWSKVQGGSRGGKGRRAPVAVVTGVVGFGLW